MRLISIPSTSISSEGVFAEVEVFTSTEVSSEFFLHADVSDYGWFVIFELILLTRVDHPGSPLLGFPGPFPLVSAAASFNDLGCHNFLALLLLSSL